MLEEFLEAHFRSLITCVVVKSGSIKEWLSCFPEGLFNKLINTGKSFLCFDAVLKLVKLPLFVPWLKLLVVLAEVVSTNFVV